MTGTSCPATPEVPVLQLCVILLMQAHVWGEAQQGYNLEKVSKTGSKKDGNSAGEGTRKEEAVAHETGQEALPKDGGSEVMARCDGLRSECETGGHSGRKRIF